MPNGIPAPSVGRLTFEVEGQEGGPFHSRHFHVPSSASGLTIGRGYDMKLRTKAQIRDDLVVSGLAVDKASLVSQAAGLVGDEAEEFIAENDLEDFEITPEAQLALFEIEYERMVDDARRLATKADVTRHYGETNWDKLNETIREVLVDLRFRGDYTPSCRRFLQVHVAGNNLRGFAKEIADRSRWPNVPKDRFERRKAVCDAVLA